VPLSIAGSGRKNTESPGANAVKPVVPAVRLAIEFNRTIDKKTEKIESSSSLVPNPKFAHKING